MSYYLLRYDRVVDHYVERRAPFREEHLALIRDAHARGEIVMAGAVGETPDGAVIVFRSASPDAVHAFAQADPYVREGLVLEWRVEPWHVVVGGATD